MRHGRPRRAASISSALLSVLALGGCSSEVPPALVTDPAECTHVAAPDGSDAAPGTVEQPFASAQHLVDALEAGEVGCLRDGRYDESLNFNRGGQDGSPLVLTSYPGERAEIRGRMQVRPGSDHVTVSRLRLVGDDSGVSPGVFASHAVFEFNEVTNDNQGICFNLGYQDAGRADDFVLRSNRIHHCGRLPAENRDHGIYVNQATGGQILNNVIYDNADRGIQLYPNAVDTLIRGNVIDGNGQGVLFGSEGDNNPTVRMAQPSSGNVVEHNVISNSNVRSNVEVSWGGDVGQDNVVRENCLFGGAEGGEGGVQSDISGVRVTDNVIGAPEYADREDDDFKIGDDSPCRDVLKDDSLEATPVTPGALG